MNSLPTDLSAHRVSITDMVKSWAVSGIRAREIQREAHAKGLVGEQPVMQMRPAASAGRNIIQHEVNACQDALCSPVLAALQVLIDRQHVDLLHSCDLSSHLGSLCLSQGLPQLCHSGAAHISRMCIYVILAWPSQVVMQQDS